MALTPQNNEAFLREVDDELRKDQALDFWRRYGRLMIVLLVVGLVLLAGFLFWQHQRERAAEREGEQLQAAYDALSARKNAEASRLLGELAQSRSDGYRAVALFTQADVALQRNDLPAAARQFGAIAADTSLSKPFRDMALVRQTSAEFDTLKPEVVVTRLRGLAVPGNPWFGSAGELVAVSYLKQGRRDLAARLFRQIAATEGVPPSIRQRTVQMAGVMGAAGGTGKADR